MRPGTPAVAVERGTTPDQRVVFSTLEELPARAGVQGAGLKSPTLLVIGEVVALAPGWVEWEASGRPLELAPSGARSASTSTAAAVERWMAAGAVMGGGAAEGAGALLAAGAARAGREGAGSIALRS